MMKCHRLKKNSDRRETPQVVLESENGGKPGNLPKTYHLNKTDPKSK